MSDTIVRKPLPRQDSRLGRLIVHDERSKDFPFRASLPGVRKNTRHSSAIGIMNQGSLGSCTGHAGAKALSTQPFYQKVEGLLRGHYRANERFAQDLYSDATHIDAWEGEWPPIDTGSSGLAIAQVLKNRGNISGYAHAFNTDAALDALVGSAVIIGIPWYNNMFNPDADGFLSPTGNLAGGHELCLSEINVDDEYVEGPNSWGKNWGPLGGRFRLKWDVLDQLLSNDGDCTIFIP